MTSTPEDPTTELTGRPPVVDLVTWQAARDELLVREKAHTREGDAIAAARRRLPMVEFDPKAEVVGADGPVPFLSLFQGRDELVVALAEAAQRAELAVAAHPNDVERGHREARGEVEPLGHEGDPIAPHVDLPRANRRQAHGGREDRARETRGADRRRRAAPVEDTHRRRTHGA